MKTRYMLVQTIEGQMMRSDFDDVAALEVRYGEPVSYTDGKRGLRPELQGQPVFAGLVGPMWGGTDTAGNPLVRYEDSETNDRLSA